jgi:hypothetical protein
MRILAGALLVVALASCTPMTDEMPKKQLTERQRDSLIGSSDLPGAGVMKRTLDVSDRSANRAASIDSLTR